MIRAVVDLALYPVLTSKGLALFKGVYETIVAILLTVKRLAIGGIKKLDPIDWGYC